MKQPTLELPDVLRSLLSRHGAETIERVESFLQGAARPCALLRSKAVPGSRRGLRRFLGPAPVLLPTSRSKFGGQPHTAESDLSWKGYKFLGQVNFAEIEESRDGLPTEGVLGIDVSTNAWRTDFRIRWDPLGDRRATASSHGKSLSYSRREAEICFEPAWSLPRGRAWEQVVPDAGDVRDAWNDWSPAGFFLDHADGWLPPSWRTQSRRSR